MCACACARVCVFARVRVCVCVLRGSAAGPEQWVPQMLSRDNHIDPVTSAARRALKVPTRRVSHMP